MPQNFDTVIGERGVDFQEASREYQLPGFLKDAKILILDDATSASIWRQNRKYKSSPWYKNITKFIIAHRISAVKNADEILIFEDGEIVERGKHQELLDLKEKYYETYLNQLGKMMFYDEGEVI